MSAHRVLVRQTVDEVARRVTANLTVTLAQCLHNHQVKRIQVPSPTSTAAADCATSFAAMIRAETHALIGSSMVPDLEEAIVTLTLAYRARRKSCSVQELTSSRRFIVADSCACSHLYEMGRHVERPRTSDGVAD